MEWVLQCKCCKSENFRENFIFASSVKDVFAVLKIRDKGMIYLYQSTIEWFRHFARILFSRNFAYMRSFSKIKPSRKFPNLYFMYVQPKPTFIVCTGNARTLFEHKFEFGIICACSHLWHRTVTWLGAHGTIGVWECIKSLEWTWLGSTWNWKEEKRHWLGYGYVLTHQANAPSSTQGKRCRPLAKSAYQQIIFLISQLGT